LLANSVQAIDNVAADAGGGALRIHLNRPEAAGSIALLLGKIEGRAKTQIILCVPDGEREIDLILPGEFPVTPQVRGAIKAMQGVLAVEEV
jgi:DNA polymerase-3 subunit alpha